MHEPSLRARMSGHHLDVALHVQPRARKTEIGGIHNGALKLKVAAPPVDDAANRALLKFIAELLEIPGSRLKIIAGEKSRDKILRINDISLDQFLSRLRK